MFHCEPFSTYFSLSSGETKPEDTLPFKQGRNIYPVLGGNGILGYSSRFNHTGKTVVIGRVGEKCGCIHVVHECAWISDNALYTKGLEENDEYLFWGYLLSHVDISRLRNKGGQPLVSQKPILSLKHYIPSKTERNKIAEILGACDAAIEAQERLIAQKQQRKKGLMQQLLTGKVRFPEFRGREAWREVKLGQVFKERSEIGREDLELLAVTGQGGVVKRDGLTRRDTSSEDKSKYKRVCPGDIAYNTMRMWQGVSGLSQYEGIVSPAYTILKPGKEIDPLFASYFFKLPETINLFHRYSQGLVSDTLNLKYPNFKVIHVAIPGKLEQEKIGRFLFSLDEELLHMQAILDQLKLQKKGLMQQLLTGKVRVAI